MSIPDRIRDKRVRRYSRTVVIAIIAIIVHRGSWVIDKNPIRPEFPKEKPNVDP
jgi:hypothetical protein